MKLWLAFSFFYPGFLWALSLLIVPILIHLISFRRYKTIQFSDISLLKKIEKEGVARKKLRDRLVLILRCLALIFLVIAFSMPYTGGSNLDSPKQKWWILLDDSQSMEGSSNDVERFSAAKKLAIDIIEQSADQQQFIVLGNSFAGFNHVPMSRDQAILAVQSMQISPKVNRVEDIFYLLKSEAIKDLTVSNSLFWISDFELDTDSISELPANLSIHLIPVVSGVKENVYIDSIWFEQPVRKRFGEENLICKIVNNGAAAEKFEVKYVVNNVPSTQMVDLPEKQALEVVLNFQIPQEAEVKGMVSIADNSCLFDNKMYFSYQRQNSYKVLSISQLDEFNSTIRKIIGNDSTVDFTAIDPKQIDLSKLKYFDVIVLGELDKLAPALVDELLRLRDQNGVKLIVVSNPKARKEDYAYLANKLGLGANLQLDSVREEVQRVKSDNLYFKDVFDDLEEGNNKKVMMPKLSSHFLVEKIPTQFDVLLYSNDRDPLMLLGDGIQIMLFGITDQHSEWKKNPLIVPVIYKAVFEQVLKNQIYYQIGEDQVFYLKGDAKKTIEVTTPDQQKFKATLHGERMDQLLIGDAFMQNGYYPYTSQQDSGTMALNYSTRESRYFPDKMDVLKSWAKSNKNVDFWDLKEGNNQKDWIQELLGQPKHYWKEALVLSFLFLVLEIVVIRLLGKRFTTDL